MTRHEDRNHCRYRDDRNASLGRKHLIGSIISFQSKIENDFVLPHQIIIELENLAQKYLDGLQTSI